MQLMAATIQYKYSITKNQIAVIHSNKWNKRKRVYKSVKLKANIRVSVGASFWLW
jgi:hypothetical protein